MTRVVADPVQELVDELAAQLGLSVLIDDDALRAMRWSAQSATDPVRLQSILDHTVVPAAQAVVSELGLPRATGVIRTPAVPDVGMQARWCAPIRVGSALVGYLWVLDPDGVVTSAQREEIGAAARYAGRLIAAGQDTSDDRRRRELLSVLTRRADPEAARALLILERQPDDIHVVADTTARLGGWSMGGFVVHPVSAATVPGMSGAPLPLVDLGEALRRARLTVRAIAAGARLAAPRWDCLHSWHLIVDAPEALSPAEVCPGVENLLALSRPDLIETARTVSDLGGDVRSAASALHLHRTTLYYRLQRITALTGVDLRDGAARGDLDLALRLAAFRAQP